MIADPKPVRKVGIDGQNIEMADVCGIHQLMSADDADIMLRAGAAEKNHSFERFCQFFTSLKSKVCVEYRERIAERDQASL